MVVLGSGPGGSRTEGVEDLLYISCPGGPTIWGGDLGTHSKDGEVLVQFSDQGRKEDHWGATTAKERRELGICNSGGGTELSRNGGDTDIHNTEAEYGCAIYCDKKSRIFINGLEFLVLDENKCYRYISCVTFFSTRHYELFLIYKLGELDLFKTTKQ